MALIKCSECGKEISDKASACPNCGCPVQYQIDQKANIVCASEISWESVYLAIDNGDLISATKLIKTITGASTQEARNTAALIRSNRSTANKSSNTKTGIQTNSDSVRRNSAVCCLKCGKLYYSDMKKCPGCGSLSNAETTKPYVDPSKTICVACSQQISKHAEACPHCGRSTGIHVCPKCNGVNTKAISSASKATSVFLWGPFAANKVLSKYQCKDCGHKF